MPRLPPDRRDRPGCPSLGTFRLRFTKRTLAPWDVAFHAGKSSVVASTGTTARRSCRACCGSWLDPPLGLCYIAHVQYPPLRVYRAAGTAVLNWANGISSEPSKQAQETGGGSCTIQEMRKKILRAKIAEVHIVLACCTLTLQARQKRAAVYVCGLLTGGVHA